MPDLFSPDQLAQIGAISAAFSEPETRARIGELLAEQAKIDTARSALLADHDKIAEMLNESRRTLVTAEEMKAAAEAHEAKVAEWEGRVGAINNALNQEKIAFQGVREKVESDNAAESERLAALEQELEKREELVHDREVTVAQHECLLEKAIAKHQAKVARLRDALADPPC